MMTEKELRKKAFHLRHDMLKMCAKAGTGHVTSSTSCMDVLTALYYGGIMNHNPKFPDDPERDRFLMSKGQASPALYTVLADQGYFPKRDMDTFAQKNGRFGVHLQNSVPGVEITCGSLGHGFGIAAGIALGAKMGRNLHLTFALLGDGECYEGSIWEAAMFASHNRLNNLIAIVDRNYLCVTDFTENLMALEPLEKRWSSFGWDVRRIDGHCFSQIMDALSDVRSRKSSRPLCIIADTVKGQGIDLMANVPRWHGLAPGGEQLEASILSLKKRCEKCAICEREDIGRD